MVGLLDLVSSPIRIYVFGNLSLTRFFQEQSPQDLLKMKKNLLNSMDSKKLQITVFFELPKNSFFFR